MCNHQVIENSIRRAEMSNRPSSTTLNPNPISDSRPKLLGNYVCQMPTNESIIKACCSDKRNNLDRQDEEYLKWKMYGSSSGTKQNSLCDCGENFDKENEEFMKWKRNLFYEEDEEFQKNACTYKGDNANKVCEEFIELKGNFDNQTGELSDMKNPCFERGKNVCEGNEICFDRQKYEPLNEDIMKLKKNTASENENNDVDEGEDEYIKWRNNFFSEIYGSTQIDEPSSEENGENFNGENVNEEDELDLELHL